MTEPLASTPSPTTDEGIGLPCPHCGYDLRGIHSDRCPECGETFERSALRAAYLPWECRRRGGGGWIAAYVKTALLFTLRPSQTIGRIGPDSYRHGVRFRAVTVALVSAPILIAMLVWFFRWLPEPRWEVWPDVRMAEDGRSLFRAPGSFAVSLACVVPIVALVTGAPEYFFRSKRLSPAEQGRAVALLQYACAPLACLPLGIALAAGGLLLGQQLGVDVFLRHLGLALRIVGMGSCGGLLLMWWWVTLRLLRLAAGAGWIKCVSAAVVLPASWIVIGAAVFILFQFVVTFVALVASDLISRGG